MPSFSTPFGWRGIGTTAAVELLTVVALGFAVVSYAEWSSDKAVAGLDERDLGVSALDSG